MGKVLMSGGGGSVDLDVITAGAEHILAGTVGLDKEGEPLEGSMPDNSGIDTNGTVPGINSSYPHLPTREGSALQFSTTTDGSNVIALCPPQGYYPGGGGSYVHRPASDFGNATASKVLSGNTFTSENGIKLEGNVSVQSILSFSAAPYSSNQITFTWKNPAKGAFSGVIIVGKTGSYPTSRSDGTQWYKGSGSNQAANGTSTAIVSGFAGGTTYYFRAFSYAIKDNAEWVSDTTYTGTAATTKGIETIKSSTTWTVPANVRSIDIFCVGGGGAGGGVYVSNSDDLHRCTGGAGGGKTATKKGYAVTPGQQFVVTIGAGGASVTPTNASNTASLIQNGKTTSFGSVLSADGGSGSAVSTSASANYFSGADGGSGGGGAGNVPTSGPIGRGGNGGSNGSDGKTGIRGYKDSEGNYTSAPYNNQGKGQGTTTKAFGESSGTLYAGGGGGGGFAIYNDIRSGYGGDGGGGDACMYDTEPKAGTVNTGGGGGGNCCSSGAKGVPGAAGGSGICIVRWGY